MTNYEKIKQISLENLAVAINNNCFDVCNYCIYAKENIQVCKNKDCIEGITKWLELDYNDII